MRILAVAPHPDDLDVAAAGFLSIADGAGHVITVVCMTNGETGGDPLQRAAEQRTAADVYHASVIFFEQVDTQVEVDRQSVHRAEACIAEWQPDVLLIPGERDSHQDHRATASLWLSAGRYLRTVLHYETPTSLRFEPTVFVNVGAVLRDKRRAVLAHDSQLHKPRSIAEASRAFYRFRGWQARVAAAEGFEVTRFEIGDLFDHM